MENKELSDSGTAEGAGSTEPKTDSKKTEPEVKPDLVSRKAYESVADDMHRFKNEARDSRQKLADLEAKKLADEKNYQALYENEKKLRADAEDREQKKDKYYIHTQKAADVRHYAMEAGLRSEAVNDLDLLDFDGVKVEVTDQGRYLVHGGKEFINHLKNARPHWFTKDKPPVVNAGGGGSNLTGATTLTPKDVVDAERKWKRGKLTEEQYHDVFTAYRKQKRTS